MKKQYGPAFKAQQLDLTRCPVCKGKAVTKGVFHELPCVQCNASGWVSADTGHPLPLEVLVTQLSIRLQATELQLEVMSKAVWMGVDLAAPESIQYEQNNRRGAGGTNYTGD
ncbi:hypothetical protein HU732_23710 [Pseudomonas proteolytica]|uniref:hypothetical protein n=1 Tax=Pseudomonas proteolytica TaxID=219574 RepID=UPI0016497010|nr:hypothetical protein [Pseudomonas proteolytica]MBC3339316.1 hypothetical protein [Pseudomonas proteolytica]